MPVDEATTLKMHSKVRWGNAEEVAALLKIAGTADCLVRGALRHAQARGVGCGEAPWRARAPVLTVALAAVCAGRQDGELPAPHSGAERASAYCDDAA